MSWPPILAAAFLAVAVLLVTAPLLRRLPEPSPSDADSKPTYRSLATPGFVGATALASLVGALAAFAWTPPAHWLAWTALAGVNVVACAIDARTTWLPLRLSQLGWLVAALGVVAVAVAERAWTPLLPAALGAGVAGGFFHLVWRLSRGIGYGDVRLAATIGAVTALGSPGLVAWSLALGTAAGALLGIVHSLRGRAGPFAYGPGLLVGPFAALAGRALIG